MRRRVLFYLRGGRGVDAGGGCGGVDVGEEDAEGLRPPPSSSRSGDPPMRGMAVRCRYTHATNRGIPARSARMTAEPGAEPIKKINPQKIVITVETAQILHRNKI